MQQSEIKEGHHYRINHTSGRGVEVLVQRIYRHRGSFNGRETIRYLCRNIRTQRNITVKSAAKFISEVPNAAQQSAT